MSGMCEVSPDSFDQGTPFPQHTMGHILGKVSIACSFPLGPQEASISIRGLH